MQEAPYTKAAMEALNRFLAVFPPITHPFHNAQIARSVEHYMLREQAAEVTVEILIQALEDRYPQNEPLTLMLRDPKQMADVIASQKAVDPNHPVPAITRWPAPETRSAPAGKDVFAFHAGSRKGGNTDRILDAVLEGARETGGRVEKRSFADLKISPCTGCLGCKEDKLETRCVIQDDMPQLYPRFLECDVFVFGFPVYSGRESAQAAIFIDRLKALTSPWRKPQFKARRGAIVGTWGWPSPAIYSGLIIPLAMTLFSFGVEICEVIAGSGFWDAYYKKGSAALDPTGLEQARNAGKALVL